MGSVKWLCAEFIPRNGHARNAGASGKGNVQATGPGGQACSDGESEWRWGDGCSGDAARGRNKEARDREGFDAGSLLPKIKSFSTDGGQKYRTSASPATPVLYIHNTVHLPSTLDDNATAAAKHTRSLRSLVTVSGWNFWLVVVCMIIYITCKLHGVCLPMHREQCTQEYTSSPARGSLQLSPCPAALILTLSLRIRNSLRHGVLLASSRSVETLFDSGCAVPPAPAKKTCLSTTRRTVSRRGGKSLQVTFASSEVVHTSSLIRCIRCTRGSPPHVLTPAPKNTDLAPQKYTHHTQYSPACGLCLSMTTGHEKGHPSYSLDMTLCVSHQQV